MQVTVKQEPGIVETDNKQLVCIKKEAVVKQDPNDDNCPVVRKRGRPAKKKNVQKKSAQKKNVQKKSVIRKKQVEKKQKVRCAGKKNKK